MTVQDDAWKKIDVDGDGVKGTQKDKKAWSKLGPADRALYALSQGDGGIVNASDPTIKIPSWVLSKKGTVSSGYFFDPGVKGTVPGAKSAKLSELQDLPTKWASTKSGRTKLARLSNALFGRPDAELGYITAAWNEVLRVSAITGQSVERTISNPQFRQSWSLAGQGPQPFEREAVVLARRSTTNETLTQTMIEWLGTAPTEQELKSFYERVISLQKKRPTIYKGDGSGDTVTTEGGVDIATLARKFVLKKLAPDKDLDGYLGTIQSNLKTLAQRNGIVVSDAEILGILKKIAKGANFEDYKVEFNERAAKKYTALADALRANPDASVYDLSIEYIRDMADILEIDPNQIKLSDIEKAIAFVGPDGKQRTLASWEWKKMLRDDPRFQSTSKARSEASDLATGFARAFGVNL